ncbi:uncharacterized protein [Oncorhynchus clarkii lewisi]|uniref:uncharacterized protein n=1 Tax=Oncorhynchus clarkii lewisi TaxID=490388 RepID=UPI0039B83FF1
MILKTLGVNYTCPVSQLEFQLVSVRTCTNCGRESSTREDYNHLSLDFSSERTLLSSLALTFKGEKLNSHVRAARASTPQRWSSSTHCLLCWFCI